MWEFQQHRVEPHSSDDLALEITSHHFAIRYQAKTSQVAQVLGEVAQTPPLTGEVFRASLDKYARPYLKNN